MPLESELNFACGVVKVNATFANSLLPDNNFVLFVHSFESVREKKTPS